MPNIFHECLEKGDAHVAVGHLEELLDNLFKLLDDPKCARNHAAARQTIASLVSTHGRQALQAAGARGQGGA